MVVNSFFTYAGIEVNAVHVNDLRNPAREYPKAIFVAMALVLVVFIFPTLAISWVIPAHQISFTAGVMQAFNRLFTYFGAAFAVPLVAVALAAAAFAGMLTWMDGPSEGLLLIGRERGFLPPYFQKVNRHGIEMRILAAQGAVITLIALLYAFIPSVSHAYWIFVAMATQVYLIMYVLMFIAAIRLRRAQPDHPRGYRAPALGLLCVLGATSSVAALVIGFIPPAQFRPLKPAHLRRPGLGRGPRRRDRPAAADGPAPQAGVEDNRRQFSPPVVARYRHSEQDGATLICADGAGPAKEPRLLPGGLATAVDAEHGIAGFAGAALGVREPVARRVEIMSVGTPLTTSRGVTAAAHLAASAGTAGSDPSCVAAYMLSQMQRNISTACFVITDTSGASPLLSSPGCVIASPSYKGYARGVVPVDEDYVYNWTRDAAITVSEVLHSAPALMPTAVAVQTLTDYVSFADACQKSTPGDIGRGKYDVQGGGVAWSSQSDGPALRVLTLLQGYSSLSPATQTLAQQVIARDLACLLGPSPSCRAWRHDSMV